MFVNDDLDNQLTAILDKAEPWNPAEEKPAEVQVEAKENSEEEGVNNAAESSQEADESEGTEGQTPSDEFEEELKNIDPEVREALLKVDAEVRKAQLNAFKKMRSNFDKKQTEFGQEKKIAENAKQLFSKYGLDPNNGLSQLEKLIRFERELEKDPKKVVGLLKQKFNLQDERAGSDELDESLLTDEEKLLYKNQKNIEKTVETLVEENRRLKENQENREIEAARTEIEKFKNSKNDDGSLKNPYFDDLIGEIGKLTELYPKDNIEALYNKALRLNDDVYSKSLEEAKAKERSRILSEKEKALNKAKSINSQSIKSSPKASAQPSLDDELLAILSKDPAYSN